MQKALLIYFVLSIIFFSCDENEKKESQSEIKNQLAKESVIISDTAVFILPIIENSLTEINTVLKKSIPIKLLNTSNSDELLAQELAIQNPLFCKNIFDSISRKALRTEIFNIYIARPQEIPATKQQNKIYKVEMYNYALNMTTTAMVDVSEKNVISIHNLPQSQPDIPSYLKDIAVQIATNHPAVLKALGYKPEESDVLMANTKTALNNTKCERSNHLCVAPTFTIGDKALWVIVDLTDFKIVGLRWTYTGSEQKTKRVSEKNLKFEKIMQCYCKQINTIERDTWKLDYIITTSDGLRISDVKYKGQMILHSAKVVDWHVNYSNTEGFGYSDAVGCPEFSMAAVVAVSEPRISDIIDNGVKIGFALEQNFSSEQWPLPCNYNYLQRFEFYNDGRFRCAAASLGRGCGNNGTYRPVFRIHFAGEKQNFYQYSNEGWQAWQHEKWVLEDIKGKYTPEGYLYKIETNDIMGYYLEPSKGQFGDGGRGDNAYTYVTKWHAQLDEGDNDLVTIGPCCNTNYEQGPEKFIQNEDITNTKIVLWYVPQMKNDDTPGREYCWSASVLENGVYKTKVYPCLAGPMFVPYYK